MVQVWFLCTDKAGEKTPEHRRVMCIADAKKIPKDLADDMRMRMLNDKSGEWTVIYSLNESIQERFARRVIQNKFPETPFRFIGESKLR